MRWVLLGLFIFGVALGAEYDDLYLKIFGKPPEVKEQILLMNLSLDHQKKGEIQLWTDSREDDYRADKTTLWFALEQHLKSSFFRDVKKNS